MNPSAIKAKGRDAENLVVEYLKMYWPLAERRRLTGAQDRGDVSGIPHTVIEVKDCVRTDLAGWLKELEEECAHDRAHFGAVVHKRKGTRLASNWYVTLPLWRFVDLLERALRGFND